MLREQLELDTQEIGDTAACFFSILFFSLSRKTQTETFKTMNIVFQCVGAGLAAAPLFMVSISQKDNSLSNPAN